MVLAATMLPTRSDKAATVRRGPYAGGQLPVDHIIPRAVCPESDNVIANLQLMPTRMDSSKSDKIGTRQLDLARKLHSAGLLSGTRKWQGSTPPPLPRLISADVGVASPLRVVTAAAASSRSADRRRRSPRSPRCAFNLDG